MSEQTSFGNYLGKKWYFLMICFVHMVNNADDMNGGEKLLAFLITGVIIIALLYWYWYANVRQEI